MSSELKNTTSGTHQVLSSQSSPVYADTEVSDRNTVHELTSSSGSQLLTPNRTHQEMSTHPTTQCDGEEGCRLMAMSADEEIRGCSSDFHHPSNDVLQKCGRGNLADGCLERILHIGDNVASDLSSHPAMSLTLAEDVAELNEAGGDGSSWRATHKPLLNAQFSWFENERSNSNHKLTALSAKDLATPLSPAVIPDPSPPSPTIKPRSKPHRPFKTLRKLFTGSKSGSKESGRLQSTTSAVAVVIESAVSTNGDTCNQLEAICTRDCDQVPFDGAAVELLSMVANVRVPQNADVVEANSNVVDTVILECKGDPEEDTDLTSRVQQDDDVIDPECTCDRDESDDVIDQTRTDQDGVQGADPDDRTAPVSDKMTRSTDPCPGAASTAAAADDDDASPSTTEVTVQTTWSSNEVEKSIQTNSVDDLSTRLNDEIARLSRRINELTSECACLRHEQKIKQQAVRQLKETVGDLTEESDDLRRQLDRGRQGENELIDELELLRQELSRLQVELHLKGASIDKTSSEITRLQRENAELVKESGALLASNVELNRTFTILQTENASLAKHVADADIQLDKMKKDLATARSERAGYKALFVEAKLQASEELGHYIDELNVSLEEKRIVFHNAQKTAPFGSFGLKRALARTEEFLLLKSEKNCLVDQVEFLSAKTLAQDMYIDELESTLDDAAKWMADFGGMKTIPEQFHRWASTRTAKSSYSRLHKTHLQNGTTLHPAFLSAARDQQATPTVDSSPSSCISSASSSVINLLRDHLDKTHASQTGSTAAAHRSDRTQHHLRDGRSLGSGNGPDGDVITSNYERPAAGRSGVRRGEGVGGRNVSWCLRKPTSSATSFSSSSVDEEYVRRQATGYHNDGIDLYDYDDDDDDSEH